MRGSIEQNFAQSKINLFSELAITPSLQTLRVQTSTLRASRDAKLSIDGTSLLIYYILVAVLLVLLGIYF